MKEPRIPLPQLSFAHDPAELVRQRVSTRAYADQEIEPGARSGLTEACGQMRTGLLGEAARFLLVDRPQPPGSPLRVTDYGFITGPRYYLLGAVERSALAFESYGYLLEHLVLRATDLGLQTCWVGYFHPEFFGDFQPPAESVFPAVVIVGRGLRSWKGRVVRLAVRAATRQDWGRLFFREDFRTPLSPVDSGAYAQALEFVRWAPSAGNRQPWRVVRGRAAGEFHFYCRPRNPAYTRRHLHRVDIGIALCHFELGARCQGRKGRWVQSDPGLAGPDSETEYRVTWMEE